MKPTQKKIKPVRAWAVMYLGKIRPITVRKFRCDADAYLVGGDSRAIPVMVVPLETWRALVKKARGR